MLIAMLPHLFYSIFVALGEFALETGTLPKICFQMGSFSFLKEGFAGQS